MIEININRCKGCGLCVNVCPNNIIQISKKTNDKGVLYAETIKDDCNNCGLCFLICADIAIIPDG